MDSLRFGSTFNFLKLRSTTYSSLTQTTATFLITVLQYVSVLAEP